jgi:DNA modification methylase
VRHNNLLTFTRTADSGLFDPSAMPKVKRLAPKPGYAETKPAGSVWDFTMSNTHPDRVGYPNQKPLEIVTPFVLAHTAPGDLVVDPFMGSGTTGVAAVRAGRRFLGWDLSGAAVEVARKRLEKETQ